MFTWLREVDVFMLIIACLTLGLAPFVPVPHIIEKIGMLFHGNLRKPIDWFDLVMHGIPWILLAAKLVITIIDKKSAGV